MGLETRYGLSQPSHPAAVYTEEIDTMTTLTRQQRARRMLRNFYQLGLDTIALNGGGREEEAGYKASVRVLLGAKAYRIASSPARTKETSVDPLPPLRGFSN